MTTHKEDPFLDAIKSKGYYSNTWKQTKHFDVDLTIGIINFLPQHSQPCFL